MVDNITNRDANTGEGVDVSDIETVSNVLAGLAFPAPRWLLIAQARHWGASEKWIDELDQLPPRTYRNVRDVAAALQARRIPPGRDASGTTVIRGPGPARGTSRGRDGGSPGLTPCEPGWSATVCDRRLPAKPPRLRISPRAKVVAVAVHCDEELCAAGGLLAALGAARARVALVAVTDDDGSGRPSPARADQRRPGRRVPAAHIQLGLVDAERVHLGARSGNITASDLAELTATIDNLLTEHQPQDTLVIAPWSRDSHPEHSQVGQAVQHAVTAAGVPLLSYLTTGWAPGVPTRLPHDRLRCFYLPNTLRQQKYLALAHRITSTGPAAKPTSLGAEPTPPQCARHEVFVL